MPREDTLELGSNMDSWQLVFYKKQTHLFHHTKHILSWSSLALSTHAKLAIKYNVGQFPFFLYTLDFIIRKDYLSECVTIFSFIYKYKSFKENICVFKQRNFHHITTTLCLKHFFYKAKQRASVGKAQLKRFLSLLYTEYFFPSP